MACLLKISYILYSALFFFLMHDLVITSQSEMWSLCRHSAMSTLQHRNAPGGDLAMLLTGNEGHFEFQSRSTGSHTSHTKRSSALGRSVWSIHGASVPRSRWLLAGTSNPQSPNSN
ncbi:hypothetical protein OG21DRAFT_135517 [Imleria badia]|nr:hypothetical protein OG21DRAFT_135517 [Imleria badia]